MHKMWMVIDARRVGFLGAAGVVAVAAVPVKPLAVL